MTIELFLLVNDIITSYAAAVADEDHTGVCIRGRWFSWERADRLLRWASRHALPQ